MKLSECTEEQKLLVALPMKVGLEKAINLMDKGAIGYASGTEDLDKSTDTVLDSIKTTITEEVYQGTKKVLDELGVEYEEPKVRLTIAMFLSKKIIMHSLERLMTMDGMDKFEEKKCKDCPKHSICKAAAEQNSVCN